MNTNIINYIWLKWNCSELVEWFCPCIFTMVSEIKSFVLTNHTANFAWESDLIGAFYFPKSIIQSWKRQWTQLLNGLLNPKRRLTVAHTSRRNVLNWNTQFSNLINTIMPHVIALRIKVKYWLSISWSIAYVRLQH